MDNLVKQLNSAEEKLSKSNQVRCIYIFRYLMSISYWNSFHEQNSDEESMILKTGLDQTLIAYDQLQKVKNESIENTHI